MQRLALCLTGGLFLFGALPRVSAAITLGQADTFEDGTTQGWNEGGQSPNPPTNVPTGGPEGAGDHYLQNVSSGADSAGGKWILINASGQWAGNYSSAGVTRIQVDFLNLGPDTLTMRLAFLGSSTWYGSAEGARIPPDAAWHRVTFDLTQLVLITGTSTQSQVMSRVNTLRIVEAAEPAYSGDPVATTAGVDNIIASSSNVPVAPTTWGRIKGRYR